MLGLSRWCISHRRLVVVGWVLAAVITTVIAGAVGRHYATDFSLPGTESQHVVDLLNGEFPAQSGDTDTIVWHTPSGTVDAANVRNQIEPLLAKATKMPHVVSVVSPYDQAGAVQVSKDRRTAFAVVNYDKRANLLPNDTGKPLLDAVNALNSPSLRVAAGGQVIENAEGFSIGPATAVGVIAALIILLITFGSLITAGMPLITAGFGPDHRHRAGRHRDAHHEHVQRRTRAGGDDRPRGRHRLRAVHRYALPRELPQERDVSAAIIGAMDTSGRSILLAGTTVIIALLGMFATGVTFMYGLAIASVLAVLLVLAASLTVLPALLASFGEKVARPSRRSPQARGQGRSAATVRVAALEPHRAIAAVAAGGRLDWW